MSVAKPPVRRPQRPADSPDGPTVHPLLALAVSLASAALAGVLVDATAAITVLGSVIGLFTAYWQRGK
ncbi:hypothetical protein [Nocardia brasiliensis]|uniref:hypothetical protein n=1 Tax=Nocardia brasiliensis TaxID=37326 RepID=UPI002455B249|nr:hypothetical protein [Nocardia brasiliensis]